MSNRLKIKEKQVKVELSQEKVLETVQSKLTYETLSEVLIKPLPPIMVKKHIIEQVPTSEIVDKELNAEGYETKEYDKDVESAFREGIVISIPELHKKAIEAGTAANIKEGDKVVFNFRFSKDFDLFKDSVLVKPYDIVAKCK